MIFSFTKRFLSVSVILIAFSCAQVKEATAEKEVQILPPEELYGQLFYDVQADPEVFPDSKTFVDVVPLTGVEEIKSRYSELQDKSSQSLRTFVEDNFDVPENDNLYQTDSSSIKQHIPKLWSVLKRPADENISGTLIPLPNPYIVPGGRFREIYYWDSYFTMLGLQEDGEIETIQNMVDNFSYLIDKYGFIPNGNRTYYLSRSQPPFYAKMVEILADIKGEQVLVDYLPYLEKEYQFWMAGADALTRDNPANKRVVLLEDGEILNRYWDNKNTPRPESYREDVKTAEAAVAAFPGRTKEDVYRNLRAGAESGWDFSSRWLLTNEEGNFQLSTIHTTDILPVDLNSLIYNLEKTISQAHRLANNTDKAEAFRQKYEARERAINKYFWDEEKQFYSDYNFRSAEPTKVISLAGVYPLFFQIANAEEANLVAQKVKNVFLKPGGVVTTPNNTGQQWDAPNGWAPLQWITIAGLRNYGHNELAKEIKNNWLLQNTAVYKRNYKLLEKYNVEDLSKKSGGGEYPTQDGFGWTNGVYQKLSKE